MVLGRTTVKGNLQKCPFFIYRWAEIIFTQTLGCTMDQSKAVSDKVNMWLMANQDKLPSEKVGMLKSTLDKVDESKLDALMMIELKSPMTIFLLAWFVGWLSLDRFLLGSVGVGIARLLTAHGLGVWWLVDLITSMKRTREFNYNKVKNLLGMF